jgi:hypothetical protein
VHAHDRAPAVPVVLGALEQACAAELTDDRAGAREQQTEATARRALAWRFPSPEFSIASRIGMGAGTALLRSCSVIGSSAVSSMRSSSTLGWGSAFVLILTAMIRLLLSFDLRIIRKKNCSLSNSISGGLT